MKARLRGVDKFKILAVLPRVNSVRIEGRDRIARRIVTQCFYNSRRSAPTRLRGLARTGLLIFGQQMRVSAGRRIVDAIGDVGP